MAESLEKLIKDKKTCREMGFNGRKIVKEFFAEKIISDQTIDLWQKKLFNEIK